MATARYALPLLQIGQAQKELTHNESIQALENAVQPIVEGAPRNAPPSAPSVGQQFLIGVAPSADFIGHANSLATWTEAGWFYIQPQEKFAVADRQTGMTWTYDAGTWRCGLMRGTEVRVEGVKVLGTQQPTIETPGGGVTTDKEARMAVAAILAALRQHGIIAT